MGTTGNGEFAEELVCVIGIEEIVDDVEGWEFAADDWSYFFETELVQNTGWNQGLLGVGVEFGVLLGDRVG